MKESHEAADADEKQQHHRSQKQCDAPEGEVARHAHTRLADHRLVVAAKGGARRWRQPKADGGLATTVASGLCERAPLRVSRWIAEAHGTSIEYGEASKVSELDRDATGDSDMGEREVSAEHRQLAERRRQMAADGGVAKTKGLGEGGQPAKLRWDGAGEPALGEGEELREASARPEL